uniref:Ycf1 n=1 Tax=Fedia cornucopiae TaxID=180554 RepID=UPI0021AC741F|nr:Ycf1 [Fedia cornucopiae]UUL71301.1 Ycf1 [Fedia cornucopiae]
MTPSLVGNIILGIRIFGIKIINSDVLRGLCCGFMTTLSVTPSYLFLVRDRVVEDELEKKVSATTGFVMGQFILLLSIFSGPLYLALSKPHTITALALPYLFVHLVSWNNEIGNLELSWSAPEYAHFKKKVVYRPRRFYFRRLTTRKRIRNFSTQCLFLKHLIFPLFNQTLLPSSTLVRLVNSNLFCCNNKIIFFSSSFLGWVISFCLLMQGVRSVSDWIEPVNLMRWHRAMLIHKKIPKEIKPYMSNIIFFTLDVINYPKRSFNIFLFFICLLYLGKMPFFISFCKKTKTLAIRRESEEIRSVEKQTQDIKDRYRDDENQVYDKNIFIVKEPEDESEEAMERREQEKNLKKEITYARRLAKDENKGFSIYFLSDEVEKEKKENILFFWFDFVEKLPVLLLFNCQEWNKPFRYITRPYLKKTISGSILKRDGMSQNFFGIGKSDGKQRLSFSYPPSLLTFWEMIENKLESKRKLKNKKITRKLKNKKITRKLKNKKIIRKLKNKKITRKLKNKKITRKLKPVKPSLYKNRFSSHKKKKTTEQKTFLHRICALNKGFFFSEILEKKNILQADQNKTIQEKKTHVLQQHDPLISGPFRTRSTVNFWEKSDTLLSEIITNRLWENTDASLSEITKLKQNSILDFLDCTRDLLFVNNNRHLINKSMRQAKQINKKVPEWTTVLVNELHFNFFRRPVPWKVEEPLIRSRGFKILVLFSYINPMTKRVKRRVKKTTYIFYPDFRKHIIYDTRRTERKKPIAGIFIPKPRSPLFWGKTQSHLVGLFRKLFLELLEIRNLKISDLKIQISNLKIKNLQIKNFITNFITNFIRKLKSFIFYIFDLNNLKSFIFGDEKTKELINGPREKNENKWERIARLETREAWEELSYGPQIRSCLLVIQSLFRQYILFPLMIIAKNTPHYLLYRVSEFDADFKEWAKEKHVVCTNSGTELRLVDVIETFYEEGFSIRIRDPFSLKPWCKSKLQDSEKKKRIKRKRIKSKQVQKNFYYLTVFGMEAEQTFGSPRTRSWDSFPLIPFLKPVFKKLKKKIKKKTKKVLSVLIFKIREKYFSEGNSTALGKLKNFSKSIKMKDKSFTKSGSIDLKLKTDLEIKKLSDTINKIRNKKKGLEKTKIKKISEIKKNKIPPDFNNILNVKLESQLHKDSWKILKILKRINVRLIKKFYYWIKIFIGKKYIDSFLPIINISVITTKHFIQLIIRNFFLKRKYISNNKKNKSQNEITEKDNDFFSISSIKKSKPIKKNSHIFYDLSCISQGYVFLKLSQLEVVNLSKLRSVLEYQETSFFIKPTIKNSFGISNSQLKDKKLQSYDQWKNWLRGHFQYNSPIEWSRLIPQKWRTQVNHRWTAKNKDFKQWGLKEKDFLFSFDYTNQTSYQVDSRDAKLRKCYRFSRLLDVCLNSQTKKESSIYGVPNLNKNNRLSKETDSNIKNSRVHFISRSINFESRRKKLDRKYGFFSKLYVNDNESDPSNSDREIYFEWINIEKDKDKLKKVFQKVVVNSFFWFFSEVAFLLKEYRFTLRQNFGFYTGSVNLERGPDNRSEAETEFERLKRTILDQRINKTKGPERNKTHERFLRSFMKHFFVSQKLWYNPAVEQRLESRLKPFTNLSEYKKNPGRALRAIITSLEGRKLEPEFISVSRRKSTAENMYCLRVVLQPIRDVRKMSEREAHIKFLINLLPYKRPARTKNNYDFPIPENILSSRGRRKLKILTSLKFKNRKVVDITQVVFKRTKKKNWGFFPSEGKHQNRDQVHEKQAVLRCVTITFPSEGEHHNRDQVDRNQAVFKRTKKKKWGSFLPKGKNRNRDQNELIKLKSFLWPNYRLEDLACMNRYWFNTNNGSRLSMLRLYMYPPRFKNKNIKSKKVPLIDLLCSLLKNVPIIDFLCSLLFFV